MKIFNTAKLNEALHLLDEQLELRNAPATELVVCGGGSINCGAIGTTHHTGCRYSSSDKTRGIGIRNTSAAIPHRSSHARSRNTALAGRLAQQWSCYAIRHGVTTRIWNTIARSANWQQTKNILHKPHRSNIFQDLCIGRPRGLPYCRFEGTATN